MKKLTLVLLVLFCSLWTVNLAAQEPTPASPRPGMLWLSGLNGSTAYPCWMNSSSATDTYKIAAAIAWLPATGGTVDLGCYHAAVTITSNIFAGITKPITLLLPPTAVTVNANVTIPANFTIKYQTGSSLAAGPTFAIIDNSSASPYGPAVSGYKINLAPNARGNAAYGYLVNIVDDGGSTSGLLTGSAAQKTYGLNIALARPTTAVATGDSNDAGVKVVLSNYAANDANYILRGINTSMRNKTGGTMGILEGGLLSSNNSVGATAPYVRGATIGAENYGVNATEHGGLDVYVLNEAAKATQEYGVRVRNLNNSIAGTSGAAFLVAEPAKANLGWDFIVDANGVKVGGHAFARMQNGAVLYFGAQTTRDTVRTEVGLGGTVGSLYLSSAGKLYLKVANANATTDWQLVTATAAD